MKTKYKYIHFEHVADNPKTQVWSCQSSRWKQELGVVKWYSPWRQYAFFPTAQTIFNSSCMVDICDFIAQLQKERREGIAR